MAGTYIVGGDHPTLAECANNIALYYQSIGDRVNAKRYFDTSLEMYERIYPGMDDSAKARTMMNAGLFYRSTEQDARAEQFLVESLAMYRRLYAYTNHRYVAGSLLNLGALYYDKGRYQQARLLFEEATGIYLRLADGGETPEYAIASSNLAAVYEKEGRFDEAEAILLRAIAIYRKALHEPGNPVLASMLASLGTFYTNRGHFNEATVALQEVLAIQRQLSHGNDAPGLAEALANMAVFQLELGNYEDARNLFEEASGMYSRLPAVFDRLKYVTMVNNFANYYQMRARYVEAESLYVRSLTMHRNLYYDSDHPSIANTLANMGGLYYNMGRFDEAMRKYDEALSMMRRIYGDGDNAEIAAYMSNLAMVYVERGRLRDAEEMLRAATEMLERLFPDGHPRLANALNNLATFYYDHGRIDSAEVLFERTLAMYRSVYHDGMHFSMVGTMVNLASVREVRGNYVAAERMLLSALDMLHAKVGPDHPEIANVIDALAILSFQKGIYHEAESLHVAAHRMRQRLYSSSDHPDIVKSLNNLAYFHNQIGKVDSAELEYLESLSMARRIYGDVDHPAIATCMSSLAGFYHSRGRIVDAMQLEMKAVEMRRRLFGDGMHPDLITSLENIASIAIDRGSRTRGGKLLETAIRMRRRLYAGVDHVDLATSLTNLARFYGASGDLKKANTLATEAVAMLRRLFPDHDQKDLAAALEEAGKIDGLQNRFPEALATLTEVLMMRRRLLVMPAHPDIVETVHNLGMLYFVMGNVDSALTYYREYARMLVEQLVRSGTFESESEQLSFLGLLQESRVSAIAFFLRILDSHPEAAEDLTDFILNTRGTIGERLAESHSLARSLEASDSIMHRRWDEYSTLRRRLAFCFATNITAMIDPNGRRSEIDSLERCANRIEKELMGASASFAAANRSIHWLEVAHALRAEEAYVEFVSFNPLVFAGERDSTVLLALVVRPEQSRPIVVPLGTMAAIKQLLGGDVADLNSYLKDATTNEALYNDIWAPLSRSLGNARRVYLTPIAELGELSLGLLRDSTGAMLSERIDLHYITGARALTQSICGDDRSKSALMNSHAAGYRTAAIFGGPRFDIDSTMLTTVIAAQHRADIGAVRSIDLPNGSERSVPFNPLPGAEAEADYIDSLLTNSGWKTFLFTGSEATEDALKGMRSPTVLHIATHGFSFPPPERTGDDTSSGSGEQFRFVGDPMLRSGIALTGANLIWLGSRSLPNIEDGIVTAYEITNLDLSATELVVLSACKTGLGELRGTEGIFGLQRAFMIAGARCVIMSMWPVSDNVTQKLMAAFYRHWIGGESKSRALVEAQCELAEYYDDPYVWGAFVLVEGDIDRE